MLIQSIDYLRGIMALTVVLYHFSIMFNHWGPIDSSTLLGRFGVYAVSAFYVISGMAMYLAHKSTEWTASSYSVYMLKRYIRLAPVYCLALAIMAFMSLYLGSGFKYEFLSLVTNITLTFGIFNPSDYIVMGGWSIGNEVVFYLFAPLFIFMTSTKFFRSFLFCCSFALLFYLSYFYLDSNKGLGGQWNLYIKPLNQIFFFMLGVGLASFLLAYVGKFKKLSVSLSLALFFIFMLYPEQGDLINIMTGGSKIVFSLIIVSLCASFYLIGDLTKYSAVHFILKFLGDISYPLYLLHGLTFVYFRDLFKAMEMPLDKLLFIGVIVLISLMIVSWICHISIEKPLMRVCKRYLSDKPNVKTSRQQAT